MSSFVVSESFVVCLKEGAKIGVVWLVLRSCLLVQGRENLLRFFNAGIMAVFVFSLLSFIIPAGSLPREYAGKVISTSFALILIASGAALFNASGINLFSPFGVLFKRKGVLGGVFFAATAAYFIPDSVATVIFLRELAFMKETRLMTMISGLAGAAAGITLFLALSRLLRPSWTGSFFSVPQLLLFLAVVKLLGSGTKGVAELSLIPAVQRGFMKFTHDFIHQTFVLLMVPDHPMLELTVWNFIGFFFGPNFASYASLLILLFLPLLFLRESLFVPVTAPVSGTGAEKRKYMAFILSSRRRKSLPVILFICFIVVGWFSGGGESVSRLYIPAAKPVVDDKGIIMIPLNDPTMNLLDGALHKFAVSVQGEEIRILVIRKSDNNLAVCLDACEICPPDGYGQMDGKVVCIYCNTPIPVDTLGKPGGCNPIPLPFSLDDRFIRIDVKEIMNKWEYVRTGKSREVVP